ncbi:HsdM family class I SAM-dependent methyltransferase [Pleionea litopenaei]|uniref:site-specific DNA-methyltransferase (adenine-specific) n=1 Tax=Pleionea litopenaei TaxID=3070815 RepID=A0AA51RXK3_9GAMM|nr:Eco57I restriction-modification methylase domain-containing protein [Pleionea sp. HL-JVS1]WMS89293.1 Eco57I restriction-modification methylase domain-containing protein [Pleionea sp. HL-JVS1]WMS89314.1 Eco57I restriction-modification methylase domain-containing protein [Pleionea sp. HL-JVS1]
MRTALALQDVAQLSDPLVRYQACKAMAKGFANSRSSDEQRVRDARVFCTAVIDSFWKSLCKSFKSRMKLKISPYSEQEIEFDALQLAFDTGDLIAQFPVEDAGYLIGSIYTVMLPSALRSSLGAYYTPPPLVSRLLDLAERSGFDFGKGSVIDPACGGGAFLAPVAIRMMERMPKASAEWTLKLIGKRLRGIEIDPFAAWMSSVILEASILPLCIKAKRRLPNLVTVGDALSVSDMGGFDLVIGNPPYGRTKLSPEMRDVYSRSLYGHANLYGLFTDLALRLVRENGVVAYLTPTSFLGGQYFKSLRELLTFETTVKAIDFISDRNGVFDDVLQETLLTTYRKEKSNKHADISLTTPQGLNSANIEKIGKVKIPKTGEPWVLPRSVVDAKFIANLAKMPTRLSDLGYSVSTGQLVWNRHKGQLRSMPTKDSLPLIWAESVTYEGFKFSATRRNHVPYIALSEKQPHLVTRQSCVLLQRTTAKEQARRLIPALLPQDFLDDHGGAVVENHLNMIYCENQEHVVSPKTICVLLSTEAVDRAFRGISGSVAVSAYELNALPLPTIKQVCELERLIGNGCSKSKIESKVSEYYGEK